MAVRRLAVAAALCAASLHASAADVQELRFLVRAASQAAGPQCPAEAATTCRDDLALPEVFDALQRMASGRGASPFAPQPLGASPPEVRVELGAGTFRLQSALRLTEWNARGTQGRLTVSGAGTAQTVVTGAVAIAANRWYPVPATQSRLSAAALPYVRVADLAGALAAPVAIDRRVSGFGVTVAPVPVEVYADGRPLTLSRWPNAGWAAPAVPANGTAPSSRAMGLPGGNFAAWQREPQLHVAGYFAHDWAFERIPVDRVDAAASALRLAGDGAQFGVAPGGRVRVENALSELDSPGEWFIDSERQQLYVWPPGGSDGGSHGAEVEIAVAPGLLHITSSADITLQDLTLQGTTGDAVRIDASRNVTLVDAAIRNTGNRAVVIDGGSAVALRRVAMSDLGEGGVTVSGGDRRSLVPALHVIEDCRIERFARLSRSYRPAIAIEGVGIQVLRNVIADGPHSAIVFGGNDHRIEGNQISDVVTETNDAGAIYTGRDWTTRGTVIANNLLQNIYPRLPGTVSVMGIYLDDQASGATITGNVFANVTRAVFIGGGRDNIVERNLFVASSPAIFADNRGTTWQREQTADDNGYLRRNLRNVPITSDVYRARYPRLANVLTDEPGRSKYNRATGNIFVASRDFEFLEGAQAGIALEGNRAAPWSVFRTLRGPKPVYERQDFDRVDAPPPAAQAAE